MRVHEFIWAEDRIEHIASHGVTPKEVEEVCFGRPFVQRAKSEGENPIYYARANRSGEVFVLCHHPFP